MVMLKPVDQFGRCHIGGQDRRLAMMGLDVALAGSGHGAIRSFGGARSISSVRVKCHALLGFSGSDFRQRMSLDSHIQFP